MSVPGLRAAAAVASRACGQYFENEADSDDDHADSNYNPDSDSDDLKGSSRPSRKKKASTGKQPKKQTSQRQKPDAVDAGSNRKQVTKAVAGSKGIQAEIEISDFGSSSDSDSSDDEFLVPDAVVGPAHTAMREAERAMLVAKALLASKSPEAAAAVAKAEEMINAAKAPVAAAALNQQNISASAGASSASKTPVPGVKKSAPVVAAASSASKSPLQVAMRVEPEASPVVVKSSASMMSTPVTSSSSSAGSSSGSSAVQNGLSAGSAADSSAASVPYVTPAIDPPASSSALASAQQSKMSVVPGAPAKADVFSMFSTINESYKKREDFNKEETKQLGEIARLDFDIKTRMDLIDRKMVKLDGNKKDIDSLKESIRQQLGGKGDMADMDCSDDEDSKKSKEADLNTKQPEFQSVVEAFTFDKMVEPKNYMEGLAMLHKLHSQELKGEHSSIKTLYATRITERELELRLIEKVISLVNKKLSEQTGQKDILEVLLAKSKNKAFLPSFGQASGSVLGKGKDIHPSERDSAEESAAKRPRTNGGAGAGSGRGF